MNSKNSVLSVTDYSLKNRFCVDIQSSINIKIIYIMLMIACEVITVKQLSSNLSATNVISG